MYIRLKLKNWRSIDHAELVLGPFTLLVGRNSSGKSNIVDALLFSHEISRDAELAVGRRGGIDSIRRWSPTKPYDITIELLVSDRSTFDIDYSRHEFVLGSSTAGSWQFKKERIEIHRDNTCVVQWIRDKSSVRIVRAKGEETVPDFPPTTSAILFARQLLPGTTRIVQAKLPSVRSLRPVPELMRRPQPPSESLRISESAENITTALHRMKTEERDKIVSAMKRIVPGLLDIHAIAAGRYLTLGFDQEQASEGRSQFVATEMSDGALRALALITAASQMRRNEILVIEEPEANLHPGAADVVYDVLHEASEKGNILVTTHSPEILERAKEQEILVCDYVNGVTKVGKLARAQRALVKEGLFSAAELMRSEGLRREGAEPSVVREGE